MKIKRIHVSNYRNIDGLTVDFHPKTNYVIGENNLGKSNFLALMEIVCNGRSFEESDFFSAESPIEILLDLKLLPYEYGFFGDNFCPNDSSVLQIRYSQSIVDAYPTIVCCDTGESIPARQLRKIHFLKYDTNAVPGKLLRLDNKKGAGMIVNSMIERYITSTGGEQSFLDTSKVDGLTAFINEHLGKIRSFSDYSIQAAIDEEPAEMLSRLFYLSDGARKIEATGSGVQFMAMASIDILCQIMSIYNSKAVLFDEQLYVNENGEKYLPIVLSIDEPEVHLHPFLQRSLINYYKRILCNEDAGFKELLQMCFGVDGVDGQLVIVTHSTDSLVDNYRNLIRFYKEEDATRALSGPTLNLTNTNEKHLLKHFPEIKEAFYSHCAILIEGDTEYGCMKEFASKLDISLDECEISVINASGEHSIKPLRQLLQAFGIPSVVIYDKDVKQGQTPGDCEFFTHELCFEIEIVKNLYTHNQMDLVREIVRELDSDGENVLLDLDFIKKYFNKMRVDTSSYVAKRLSDVLDTDAEEFCNMYSAWYMVKKGVLLGRTIGELLPAELIPACYADAIRKAQEVATNV